MKIIDEFDNVERKVGDEWTKGWRDYQLLDIEEDGLFSATAVVVSMGNPGLRGEEPELQRIPLKVHLFHPGYFLQRVGVLPLR